MRIIATAGHVDHGKSTLIRRLTGINPDRWIEEQERGLTIDLGFAHMQLPSSESIAFIDVPGHTRFIGNMLAGVGGINACILVVDGHEGWKPQTEEHLRILELVGVKHGIIALTKIDLCDADDRELASMDIADHVAGTFLQDAPIVSLSATTGEGLDEFIATLDALVQQSAPSSDHHRPRLFIDRVFAAKGSGTVVTGTLTDGSFAVGDNVLIAPSGREAKIRGIQTLGEAVASIEPGHRVALNLSGIEHSELVRGNVVIKENNWHLSDRVDASLQVLASLSHVVSRRGAFTVHIGSDEIPARVRVLGPESLAPGHDGLVRLHLSRSVPLLPGDHFVLRESGRSETVGGGEILDVAPKLPASRAQPTRSIERVIAEHGWIQAGRLTLFTGEKREAQFGEWIASPDHITTTIARIESAITKAGDSGIDLLELDERERLVVATLPQLSIKEGRITIAGVHDPLLDHPIVERLANEGCSPAPPTGITPPELRRLAKAGLLFEREGEWFHISALETARTVAAQLLLANPDGFTMSQFREALGVTRKHSVPLAGELDARAMTRRRGDIRIAGPKI
jgi:selenocysteine-specific elongation factor